jgi:predicted dithiol-disulfide oxidoreductase (DUF899 family)
MTDHKIGSRAEWQAAREVLLRREKEHTRMGDDLARQRRELPWVPVERDYRFETDAWAPKGRDESDSSEFWIRRHDEYNPEQ